MPSMSTPCRKIPDCPAARRAVGSGCYLFQKSDSFYGLQTAGQRIVFVVDTSGSMEGKNEGSLRIR